MSETFIDNGGVRLHIPAGGSDGGCVPLLIAPGLSEPAFDYADLIGALALRQFPEQLDADAGGAE